MRILCYGDSNTWGHHPVTGERYGADERWTGRLRELTGYEIIEEGVNGRTTVRYNPLDVYPSGVEDAADCILRNDPVDLMIVMLGTNDAKREYNVSAHQIAQGMEKVLGELCRCSRQKGYTPDILLIAPPDVHIQNDDFGFGPEADAKERQLRKEYEQLAEKVGCRFLRASDYVRDIGVDGVHLTDEGHKNMALGLAVYLKVMEECEKH